MRGVAAVLLAGLAGCAGGGGAPGCRRAVEAELFFGAVGDSGFARFLDVEVTPRFPDGLTVLDGAGRWRAPDGRLTQERSKLVIIVAPEGAATAGRLDAVRGAYKTQFRQQSVGLVTREVCADF